ncbi:MAG: single-stranded DNA-binding protein [Phycisphaeraceae bacterium]|nr:single-stranded DNA-binding protein [Phycisphaeraceae bacterium]
MANVNKVILLGRLTRDVETRYTQSNMAVGNFGLAINRTYFVGDGPTREKREETTFVDCEAWGRQAETMKQYLRKGSSVFIEGRLKLDQWEDKEGNRKSKLVVVVENFQFTDSRSGGGHGDEGPAVEVPRRGAPAGAGRSVRSDETHDPIPEDDIPF